MFSNQAIQNEIEKLNRKFYYLYILLLLLVPSRTCRFYNIVRRRYENINISLKHFQTAKLQVE